MAAWVIWVWQPYLFSDIKYSVQWHGSRLCAYACIHTHKVHACFTTYIPKWIHSYLNAYIHACTHAYMYVYIHTDHGCVYINTCKHTCTHSSISGYINTYIRTCVWLIQTDIHAYLHTYIHRSIQPDTHACLPTNKHTYLHVKMYVYAHTCLAAQTHTCTHNPWMCAHALMYTHIDLYMPHFDTHVYLKMCIIYRYMSYISA